MHTEFVTVANQLIPAQHNQAGVCGEWSPKAVIAHLVGWDASLKQFIVDIENFDPPYDVHAFNQRSVSTRAEQSWVDVMTELSTNFVELAQALSTVTADMRIYDRVAGWLGGRIADYEVHTDQLQVWVGRNKYE